MKKKYTPIKIPELFDSHEKIWEKRRDSFWHTWENILSKHLDYMKVKDTMRELFDYQGDIILHKPD